MLGVGGGEAGAEGRRNNSQGWQMEKVEGTGKGEEESGILRGFSVCAMVGGWCGWDLKGGGYEKGRGKSEGCNDTKGATGEKKTTLR